jgi:N-acetylglucosaminyl-diphospho-decaprenol L-rhamnosyltransferase
MSLVDVVVVSHNSRTHLRPCIESLCSAEDVNVIVVDNASEDGSLDTLGGLPVSTLGLDYNSGFAAGCNLGWRRGNAPFVLFLNPDGRIDERSLATLIGVLQEDTGVGLVAPKILYTDGSLQISQHHFPRLVSTYAQALFLSHLFPSASWASADIREHAAYETAGSPDWVGGACVLVRRSDLERLGGFDESFFLYAEDMDFCRRIRDGGFDIRFEPEAVCVHAGGASAPRSTLLPVLAASRVRYAKKHRGRAAAIVERFGLGLGALLRIAAARGGFAARTGHARALWSIVGLRKNLAV